MPPELAASSIQANEFGLLQAVGDYILGFENFEAFEKSLTPEGDRGSAGVLLAVHVDSLMALKTPEAVRAVEILPRSTDQVLRQVEGRNAYEPGYLLINFGQRISQLLAVAPALLQVDHQEVVRSFWVWCEEQGSVWLGRL